ncbi:MAG: ATP-binding cassette domain-containing protein [Pseudonocardiaceae bacterium]|nr:ATP-binding cassette domain-containing protein [Pseudonocardiaceae bacterium]
MSLISVEDLHAGYGQVRVLHGISFSVEEGSTSVILGANGAGKTTTLRALSGMTHYVTGRIALDGRDITRAATSTIVRRGVAHVPQGRGTFTNQTVEENLLLGGYARRGGVVRDDLSRVYELFPQLGERPKQHAGSLSGGEQQMLAIGRALMLRPRLMLLDEPSLGLAPIIIADLFRTLAELGREGDTTMLVVEQNANIALDIADRVYVLEAGRIVVDGEPETVRADESIRRAYLGY